MINDRNDNGLGKALALLRQAGVRLPEGTTPANFVDRLCVALHALLGARGNGGVNARGNGADRNAVGPEYVVDSEGGKSIRPGWSAALRMGLSAGDRVTPQEAKRIVDETYERMGRA